MIMGMFVLSCRGRDEMECASDGEYRCRWSRWHRVGVKIPRHREPNLRKLRHPSTDGHGYEHVTDGLEA